MKHFVGSVLGFLDEKLPIIFMMPPLIIIGLVSIYPLAYGIRLSFTDMHLFFGTSRSFTIGNYVEILTDPSLWAAAYRNLIWVTGSILLHFSLGLTVALLLNRPLRGKLIFQTLLIAPWACSVVASVYAWKWLLDPNYGIINHTLWMLGVLPRTMRWFSSPSLAMFTTMAVYVWARLPFMILALYAALQSIPSSDYEVAQLEGASPLQVLWYVILPRLKVVFAVVLLLRSIWIFNNFNFIFLGTGGGPGERTVILPLYVYRLAWVDYLIGKGCAVTVVMFGLLIIIVAIYFKLLKLSE
jgi:multiple sugar transport system permease protein